MVYLTLQHQNFTNIQMKVDLKSDAEIELESNFLFNVNYNDDNSGCIAELKQTVRHKSNPDDFNIAVACKGHFACEGIASDEEKKEAHIIAYTLLFPYVQNLIAHLVMEAGLPPLMLRMAMMKAEEVHISNNG